MGTSGTKAKRKFNEKSYDIISSLYIKKGEKERWDEAAKKAGESRTEFICKAVSARILQLENKEKESN